MSGPSEAQRTERFRISPTQARLVSLYAERTPQRRTRVRVGLRADVDVDRLERALARVVARHDGLRTQIHFDPATGAAAQIVSRQPEVTLTRDASPETDGEAESAWPIAGAIARAIATGDARSLELDLPAAAVDASSACLVVDEIAHAYAGHALPDDVAQYPDVAEWQWQLTEGEDGDAGRAFWRRQACFPIPNGTLPLASPHAGAETDDIIARVESLDTDLARDLRAIATPDAPVAAWMAAALAALVHRLTNASTLVIGHVADGRKYQELDRVVGALARLVPIGLEVKAGDSFASLVARHAERVRTAYEWQEAFAWTDHASAPRRLPIAFAHVDLPVLPPDGPFEAIESVEAWHDTADLFLAVLSGAGDGGALRVQWTASAARFVPTDVAWLARAYRTLLAALVGDPDRPIDAIDLLDRESRRQILDVFNETARDFGERRPVHALFLARAAATPDAVAVEDEDRTWTYAQLAHQAEAVAAALRARSLRPEEVVAVCAGHSFELLAAVVGVLCAGGAFLPIDPATPRQRIGLLCADAGVRVLLTDGAGGAGLPESDVEILDVRALDVSPAHAASTPAIARAELEAGDEIAYVIYTSGSTGQPKGVMVPHRGLLNYVLFAIDAYGLGAGDRVPLHSSISFDLTITSLLAPLACGACVAIARGRAAGMPALADLLRREDRPIALLKLTPAHARLLTQQPGGRGLADRARVLVVGGEALTLADVAPWLEGASAARVINEYGPTEAVVGCTVQTVDRTQGDGPVPIGRPIANARTYVLDRHLAPVPIGAIGDLYVGGTGIARGYLGRPDLTAERFVPDPYSAVPGGRLYATGDRARLRTDGTLDYLGRTDAQVRIRAHRVEPREVERWLLQHPALRDVVVVARPDREGQPQLLAYIGRLADGQARPTQQELRQLLEQYVPEYMVPAAFIFLEELPLTRNGKIDRDALPAPSLADETPYVAPRTEREEILAGVWGQVLGVERIGIDDSYFALGGNSIRSLQIVARARDRGILFTVEDLFRHQTIRTLAAAIGQHHLPAAGPVIPFMLVGARDLARLPRDVEDAYPLSRLQAGMIFHRDLRPDSAVYHDVCGYDVRAPFDADLLRAAALHVVRRHPILRTSFDLGGFSEPLQLVHRDIDAADLLVIHDLRDVSDAARDEQLDRFMTIERHHDFALDRPPLLRFFVHRLADDEMTFWVSFHHAILDGWSDISMLVELALTYRDLLEGRVPAQAPPAARYADYIALEREALASSASREFWRDQLRGAEPLRLPRQRPAAGTGHARAPRETVVREIDVSAELSDTLQTAARRLAVPLKSVLLAAHMQFLGVVTRRVDVLTLLTAVGRPETPESERVLGLHLNSIPIRFRITGDWRALIQRTFEAEAATLPHRRFPMAEMQRELGWDRLSETSFYFTHYYQYHDLSAFPGFALQRRRIYEETNFPLVVQYSLRPETGRLVIALCYDPEELAAEDVAAMRGVLERVLGSLAASIASIASIAATTDAALAPPIGARDQASFDGALTLEERGQLLVARNDTTRPWIFEPVSAWFRRVAAERPEQVAIDDGVRCWTYRQLASRAEDVARRLRARGVGPDAIVAVLADRSCELMAALLGVLGAGAAYLPLDPALPPERLAFLVQDAGARLVLAERGLAAPAAFAADVCVIDEAGSPEGQGGDGRDLTPPDVQADSLAYVIYTSGSTGRPKGVMVTQGGLSNYLRWACDAYRDGDDRIDALVHSSIGFDLTVTSLFLPLLTGGVVRMTRPTADDSGGSLTALIDTLRAGPNVGLLKVTPAHARLLAAQLEPARLAAIARRLVVGGDALFGDDAAPWIAAGIPVVNEYGPTETVVGCVAHTVTEAIADREAIPIGLPIANTRVYVLDASYAPVPPGVAGELYVGSAGVARGYLGRPDLTAERFVPDGLSGRAGERLYRTGDRVRWRTDGELEYIGRADRQVKIRGYRIELGEIEAVLRERSGVRDAAVLVRADRGGEPRLVAYVVPEAASGGPEVASADALRRWLETQLPPWMVPAAYVTLDRLPLTHNGKIDRAALPAPLAAAADVGDAAPLTPDEELLAGIWMQVLGLDRIGPDEDYFALGGDSIRSLQIVGKARERGLRLSVDHLFRHRTLRELAAAVQSPEPLAATVEERFALVSAGDRQALLDQAPPDVVDAYPLARLQAGMIFHRELRPESAVYHNVTAYDVRASWDEAALRAALGDLLAAHPALRTSFELARFSEPLQLVHAEAPVPLHVEDLRGAGDEARARAFELRMEAEKSESFDVTRPPLVRFVVQRTSDEAFRVWVSFHHAILDGWSNVSMLAELAHRYRQRLDGVASPLSPRALEYRDFIAAERAAIGSDEARAFWRGLIDNARPTRLARWPVRDVRATGAALHVVPLPDEIGDALGQVARRLALPLKSLLLAAHLKFLSAWSGEDDVLTTLTSNGRLERPDGARVLGLHLNSTPLRLRLRDESWAELARAAFEAERAQHPFRRFPLAEIQRLGGGGALAETNFVFTHYRQVRGLEAEAGITLEGVRGYEETDFAFGPHFAIRPENGRLAVQLGYDRAQFPPAQIESMASYLARVLEAIARRPDSAHGILTALDDASSRLVDTAAAPLEASLRERIPQGAVQDDVERRVSDLARHDAVRSRPARPWHVRVREQARRMPDAPAIWQAADGDGGAPTAISYRELVSRVHRLARDLRALGVGPGQLVALCLPRSADAIVAILATLEAGAAYLPLDPDDPPARPQRVIDEAQPGVLIARAATHARFPGFRGRRLDPDASFAPIAAEPDAPLEDVAIDGETPAYVIYTSGSTGQPKGVTITHANLAHLVDARARAYGDGAGRHLLLYPLTFDASVGVLSWALATGGDVVLPAPSVRPGQGVDPAHVARLIQQLQVTHLDALPGVYRVLLEGEAKAVASLSFVAVGGEACPPDLVTLHRARAPHATLVNEYGPTETTVAAVSFDTGAAEVEPTVPIGRPLPGMRAYVLDARMQAVPVGVPGELYLGGPGVARGYWRRPEATAERFVPDPFGQEPGLRLYRTGDRARWGPDGQMAFLGRVDRQIKRRGFRIEPAEIEAALLDGDDVREAAVVASPDAGGVMRVVAYVAPRDRSPLDTSPLDTSTLDGETLRRQMMAALPSYLVPDTVIVLSSLPRRPGGKVDRAALPAPVPAEPARYVPPRGELEQTLCDIWAEVLQRDAIGVEQDFFELGGHSLLAMQVVVRVRARLQIELPLAALFEASTVSALAVRIGRLRRLAAEPALRRYTRPQAGAGA